MQALHHGGWQGGTRNAICLDCCRVWFTIVLGLCLQIDHSFFLPAFNQVCMGNILAVCCLNCLQSKTASQSVVQLSVKSSLESKLRQRMCAGDTSGSSSRPLYEDPEAPTPQKKFDPCTNQVHCTNSTNSEKNESASLHVRIRDPDRRLAHVCWK